MPFERRQDDPNLIRIFESLASIHEKQDAFSKAQDTFREELLGDRGRVPQVENDIEGIKDEVKELRNKWYGAIVTALAGLIAAVGFFIKHYVLKAQ